MPRSVVFILCRTRETRENFVILCVAINLGLFTWANITMVFSCIHSNDFPMGVGKRNVCGGVDNFTLRLGRSICSNRGFDDEYDSSIWFTYHRSPPKRSDVDCNEWLLPCVAERRQYAYLVSFRNTSTARSLETIMSRTIRRSYHKCLKKKNMRLCVKRNSSSECQNALTCQSRIVRQVDVSFLILVELITILNAEQSISSNENARTSARRVDTIGWNARWRRRGLKEGETLARIMRRVHARLTAWGFKVYFDTRGFFVTRPSSWSAAAIWITSPAIWHIQN